jgi:hypothetical protein
MLRINVDPSYLIAASRPRLPFQLTHSQLSLQPLERSGHFKKVLRPILKFSRVLTWLGAGNDEILLLIQRWKEKRAQRIIPSLDELAGTLNQALADEEKIPLPQELYDSFFAAPDRCHNRDVGAVFRVENSISDLIISDFYSPLIRQPPPWEETEDSFHQFWDDNLRRILLLLHRDARALRNSNLHTATRTGRRLFFYCKGGYLHLQRRRKGLQQQGRP